MNVFLMSDLHLGHKNILKFSSAWRQGATVDEHDEWLIDTINSVVRPKDYLYLLGDLVFGADNLHKLGRINGDKRIILGNHDTYDIQEYTKYGKILPSLYKYKHFWLSHAPVHPEELRGRVNVHGHVHHNSLADSRYFNVCVENLRGVPISLDELRAIIDE